MIPCMGMMVGLVWAGVVIFVVHRKSKVRLRELEIRELELKGKG